MGDGFGKGAWEGLLVAIANGIAHAQRGQTLLCCTHDAPETRRDDWASSLPTRASAVLRLQLGGDWRTNIWYSSQILL